MIHRARVWLLALAAISEAAPTEARTQDRFYAIVFGSQAGPLRPRYSHTWATFLKVSGEGADPGALEVYHHSISWMSETLIVRLDRLSRQPGVSLDLYQTLDVVQGAGESVTAWGPFLIAPEVYEASLHAKWHIDSGLMQYRAVDTGTDLFLNDCIHAVAAAHPVFGGGHVPLLWFGKPASRRLARRLVLRGGVDQGQVDASWLIPRLGLDRRGVEVVPPQAIPERPCGLCRIPE